MNRNVNSKLVERSQVLCIADSVIAKVCSMSLCTHTQDLCAHTPNMRVKKVYFWPGKEFVKDFYRRDKKLSSK